MQTVPAVPATCLVTLNSKTTQLSVIFRETIEPALGMQGFQARKLAFKLGLTGAAFNSYALAAKIDFRDVRPVEGG